MTQFSSRNKLCVLLS